jgi:hypothetical protein
MPEGRLLVQSSFRSSEGLPTVAHLIITFIIYSG